jgi:hypothetical protein
MGRYKSAELEAYQTFFPGHLRVMNSPRMCMSCSSVAWLEVREQRIYNGDIPICALLVLLRDALPPPDGTDGCISRIFLFSIVKV